MSEMFFVIKVFLFSALMMALLQIRVGDHNIEQHSQNWLHSSSVVQVLNNVSLGASRAITNGYRYVRGEMGAQLGASQAKASEKSKSVSSFHGIDVRHEFHKFSNEAKNEYNKEKDRIKEEVKTVEESEL